MPKRLALLVIVLLAAGCNEPEAPPPEADSPPAPRRYTRDEFKAVMARKTWGETRDLLGAPAAENGIGRRVYWTYRGITIDPATGAVDSHVEVLFTDHYAMGARYPDGHTDWFFPNEH